MNTVIIVILILAAFGLALLLRKYQQVFDSRGGRACGVRLSGQEDAFRGRIIMYRIAVVLPVIFAGCFFMVFAGSCGDREQTLGPNEHQQQGPLSSPVVGGEDLVLREENTIFIAFPETRLVKKISDPWISDAVLSMLPDGARGYFVAKGVVYVDDAETAAAIAIIAGMEDSDVSGVVWIGRVDSWGCVKCCFMDPPCNCCPKDKDKGQYIKVVAEAQ